MVIENVPIAVAIDERYAPHFATCVASIADSRGSEDLRFLMLHSPAFSAEVLHKLRGFVSERGMDLETVAVTEDAIATLPPATPHYPQIVWYRLLIPELFPNLDKVLVLDADLIVLQSLSPLFATHLDEHLLAAAGQRAPDHAANLGIDPHGAYLNTGVMIFNLAAMRAEKIGARAIALGHQRMSDLIFPEQDALNIVAAGQWRRLHPRWNAMSHLWLSHETEDPTGSRFDERTARVSPAIVHFEGGATTKPWLYRSIHPLRNLYRDYRSTTPWPLERLEQASARNAILRAIPPRSQYALARAKVRLRRRQSERPAE